MKEQDLRKFIQEVLQENRAEDITVLKDMLDKTLESIKNLDIIKDKSRYLTLLNNVSITKRNLDKIDVIVYHLDEARRLLSYLKNSIDKGVIEDEGESDTMMPMLTEKEYFKSWDKDRIKKTWQGLIDKYKTFQGKVNYMKEAGMKNPEGYVAALEFAATGKWPSEHKKSK